MLEFFISSPSEIVITGDFNIYVDTDCTNFASFSDSILTPFAFAQHVHFPTHDKGHTLNIIVLRSDSTLVRNISHHDPGLSDHEAKFFKFKFPVRKPATRTHIHFRPWKELDIPAFKNAILTFPLYTNSADDASELAIQVASTLADILDNQIPIKSKLIIIIQLLLRLLMDYIAYAHAV